MYIYFKIFTNVHIFQLNSYLKSARIRETYRHIYISYIFSSTEIRITPKIRAEIARAIVELYRGAKKKNHGVIARLLDGKERESAEIYIMAMIRSPCSPHAFHSRERPSAPNFISSTRSLAHSLGLSLSSSTINPKRVTSTDTHRKVGINALWPPRIKSHRDAASFDLRRCEWKKSLDSLPVL